MKNNNKNGFITFICSLIPGAGEMYMGLMKSGVSIMLLCFLIGVICDFLSMGEFSLFIPILWFYSFFHVHNLKRMSYEEFQEVEDKPIFDVFNWKELPTNRMVMRCLGVLLIVVGGKMCIDQVLERFAEQIGSELFWQICYFVQDDVIRIIFGLVIIFIGVRLITGKRVKEEFSEDIIDEVKGE